MYKSPKYSYFFILLIANFNFAISQLNKLQTDVIDQTIEFSNTNCNYQLNLTIMWIYPSLLALTAATSSSLISEASFPQLDLT